MAETLTVIVPTRSRPQNVLPILEAWRATDAFTNGARLLFVIDLDDPKAAEYQQEIAEHDYTNGAAVSFLMATQWRPLVPKLNRVANALSLMGERRLAFMGDDHLPRTQGWVWRILSTLEKTGIVYGDDGFQGERLCTWWAMTPDIVRAINGMVPADVQHLYCDNAVMELGKLADCLTYLPDVLIEHMHPVAGKAQPDAQYARVNSSAQYVHDHVAFFDWINGKMAEDVEKIKALKEAHRGE